MPRRRVDIAVAPPFRELVSRTWLRRVALRTLDAALPGRECQVSLALSDDDTIRALNRRYRGVDETTDVLSFAPDHPGSWEGDPGGPPEEGAKEPFILPPGEERPLGEVVISYPQAERQARSVGHTMERELALLIVHGLLHLLGYEHSEDEEKDEMRELEQEILRSVFQAGVT